MKSLGDFPFEYTFTRKRVKYLSIRVKDVNLVAITAPMRMPLEYIIDFVKQKSPRIIELLEKTKLEKTDNQLGNSVELFGEFYRVEKLTSEADAVFDSEKKIIRILIAIDSYEKRRWLYKKFAEMLLPELVEQTAKEMGLRYASVSIKFQKSRWGSCTAKKKIYLNAALIRAPKNVIRYVVVHELAHLVHMHHQKTFWQLVEKHCADYQNARKFLRTNGNRLFMF